MDEFTKCIRMFRKPVIGKNVRQRAHNVKSAFGRDRSENVGTKVLIVPRTDAYAKFVELRAERVEAVRKIWSNVT